MPALAAGEKGKARDVLAAIRTLLRVGAEGRPAAAEERDALARFPGFGPVALSLFPNPATGRYKDESWRALGEELQRLLSPEEYASARRTTFNAFYTSPAVIDALHAALTRLGVPAAGLVLELGGGSGNFLARAPAGLRFVGVEQDSLSGRIARARHPGQDVRIEDFPATRPPAGGFDAVIGNVPFADVRLDHRGQKFALHDYFLPESVDALAPGGVLAVVTSPFTLDKQNAGAREYLAARADFLGAIRLPSDAFKREGTAVVTDVLVLRKRAAGDPARHADPDWLGVAPLAVDCAEVAINRYFLTHPEMVLGTWTRKDTLYGEGYSVAGDHGEKLRAACRRCRPGRRSPPRRSFPAGRAARHRGELLRRRRPQALPGRGRPPGAGRVRRCRPDDREHCRPAGVRAGRPAGPRPPGAPVVKRRVAGGRPRGRPPPAECRLRRRPRAGQRDQVHPGRQRRGGPADAQPREVPGGAGRPGQAAGQPGGDARRPGEAGRIKDRFRQRVFADPDRTERLVRLYNDAFNNLRLRQFDGSHLHFPGMTWAVTLNPHQQDAVWRGCRVGTPCSPTPSGPARRSRWPPPG